MLQNAPKGPGMLLDRFSSQTVDSGCNSNLIYDLGPTWALRSGPAGRPAHAHVFLFAQKEIPRDFCFFVRSPATPSPTKRNREIYFWAQKEVCVSWHPSSPMALSLRPKLILDNSPCPWQFLGILFDFFWPGTCPNRSEMAVGFTGTHFQAEPSILDPFQTMFDVFGPT